MWNNPLIMAPKTSAKKSVTTPKKPAKKKAKPKPRAPSNAKLVKDIAVLKDQCKAQAIQITRLTEIVAGMQESQLSSTG